MMFFKNKAPSWSQLSKKQKQKVTNGIMKVLNHAGPRYKIVTGLDQMQREQGQVELQNEDFYLNQYRRGRLLDLTRNAVRNSATFNTILRQMDFNVCGTKAGKVLINFKDIELAKELKHLFSDFTRSADFFDGYSFNQVLKLIMKNQLIGGDCVLLFDDGLVEDSGKLLIYESDEIGNVSDEALQKHFGQHSSQSLGKVYSPNSRWIGTIVSRACRGKTIFDEDKCYFLKRDPDKSAFESKWLMPSNIWRVNQGRGISQAASSIASILDLEDICQFEIQATKKNSQTFAQIYNTKQQEEEVLPSAFDQSTDFSGMTDEEISQAVESESDLQERVVSFNRASTCGIVYEQMPDNWKMELLDQNHPNQNIQDFIEWIAGRSSAVFGMSRAFATLSPDDASFKAQQLMTAPAFIEAQKQLEQICDWCLYRYVNWLSKRGMFDMNRLPDNWMKFIDWSWPVIGELDENSHQEAVSKKLTNLTGSLQQELGSNWKETLEQIKEEIAYCKENGLPHPSFSMKSGGERTEVMTPTTSDNL